MRKTLSIIWLLLIGMMASAQEPITLTDGVYEKKEVFTADGVSASSLYVRALEALSDWAGSQKRSKANVDVQDKDEGLIVYKGKLYLGFVKRNFMYGYDVFADFTLKVRCKDGKIQLTMTVPSLNFHWTADNTPDFSIPLNELLPTYTYKGEHQIKKASNTLAPKMPLEVEVLVKALGEKIIKGNDDDF